MTTIPPTEAQTAIEPYGKFDKGITDEMFRGVAARGLLKCALYWLYEETKVYTNHAASHYLRFSAKEDPVKLVRGYIHERGGTDMFRRLAEAGELILSVEAFVVLNESAPWYDQFTEGDRTWAEYNLGQVLGEDGLEELMRYVAEFDLGVILRHRVRA